METPWIWPTVCACWWSSAPWRARPAEAPITDLADGELRRIVQIGPEPNSNVILVRRIGDEFQSVIDARWSDDDPRRVQRDDKHAATLNDLYWEIGCAIQTPAYWAHPEMEPYFPLPRPNLE